MNGPTAQSSKGQAYPRYYQNDERKQGNARRNRANQWQKSEEDTKGVITRQ